MSRTRKIAVAGFILGLGVILAWPFRLNPSELRDSSLKHSIAHVEPDSAFEFEETTTAASAKDSRTDLHQIAAKVINPGGSKSIGGFDLENHPSVFDVPHKPTEQSGPTPIPLDEARPAYSTSKDETPPRPSKAAWPQEIAHIVRNGDTLEKLAERYLGDSNRGLEIFDFNRDLLGNPHLLPIGVELRIPADLTKIID